VKKILHRIVLILILIALITCFSKTGILAESTTRKIRLRYDSKLSFLGRFITWSYLKDSVEYCEWTEHKEGRSIQRIKIEGEFIYGDKTFINLSFDKKTGQEDSSVVIRKVATENGKRKVVASEKDFQRSFAGIITAIQYLRTHKLKVGDKHKVDVITNKEKLILSLEITDEENIKIGDFNFPAYVIKIKPKYKNGEEMSENITIWFIKEGKFAGYIAKFKLSGLAWGGCLRLTLNKAFVFNK